MPRHKKNDLAAIAVGVGPITTRLVEWPSGQLLDVTEARYPDMSLPENVVKMIEWLLKKKLTVCVSPRWVIIHDARSNNVGEADTNNNFAAALIEAVSALGESHHE